MQTKLIVTTAVLLGLAAPAHAQLFTNGATYNFNIQNSPGLSNNVVTFTPSSTQLIDGGDVALTLTVGERAQLRYNRRAMGGAADSDCRRCSAVAVR
jgi:hypothetical protein